MLETELISCLSAVTSCYAAALLFYLRAFFIADIQVTEFHHTNFFLGLQIVYFLTFVKNIMVWYL